jgi:predicted CopG family antitoxin
MAVKTITIDLRAYEALSRHKAAGQSFSDVIKQHFETRHTAAELRFALGDLSVSEETLDAAERIARTRRRTRARVARS